MISELKLHHIGPVPDLTAEFGERLNLITGDNGLGKTFLLDACWYALTRTWAGGEEKAFYPAPNLPDDAKPSIEYTVVGKTGRPSANSVFFQFRGQTWKKLTPETKTKEGDWKKKGAGIPPMPGLVVYARIDGGFSVWDPARNYWQEEDAVKQPDAYHFSNHEVWNGLERGEGPKKDYLCNGLIRDVDSWHKEKDNDNIRLLQKVLEALSATETEALSIGKSVRVRVADVRDTPTLEMPYGPVPVTQAAAGMRRVLALAYLLVWAWQEHIQAAKGQKEQPTNRIVLLFDEVEAHLHPKWQRMFLPALLDVVNSLLLQGNAKSVQFIVTTHAPLVMGSVETRWNADSDVLFDFNLVTDGKKPTISFGEMVFARHGSAENWLASESFDLKGGYAPEAEKAMTIADAFMRQYPDASDAPKTKVEAIHKGLRAALGGDDEYWPYWRPYYDKALRGGDAKK